MVYSLNELKMIGKERRDRYISIIKTHHYDCLNLQNNVICQGSTKILLPYLFNLLGQITFFVFLSVVCNKVRLG